MQFYQKYLVLDFERIQKPLTRNTEALQSRMVYFPLFRHYETFPVPFGFVRLFRKYFNVPKVSFFQFFFDILQQTGFSKSPKGPLLQF